MKILYITVHEPLHFDEASLMIELGAEVFIGNKSGTLQPPNRMRPDVGTRVTWDETSVQDYDAIIVMHDWLTFQKLYGLRSPGQRLMWRTIGQSSPRHERNMKAHCPDAEIIRYSPKERLTDFFAGETAMIRFYKDPEQFTGWVGGEGIKMLSSRFGQRNFPDHSVLENFLQAFDWSLYGNNPGHPPRKGLFRAR